jgi:hypothetical protein
VYNVVEVAQEIQQYYAYQEPPLPVYKEDYIRFVVHAIKKYYVDRNHPEEYDKTLFITNEKDEICYDYDFNVLQEEYILILAKLNFKRHEMADVTGDAAMSYTTDALSVTGAKEGYKSIQQEIDDLEHERIRVFHKLMAHEVS